MNEADTRKELIDKKLKAAEVGREQAKQYCYHLKKSSNLEILRNLDIPTPKLPLQNQFAVITAKVESLKSKYTQSLAELENLYGSLSQRAFKGELDVSKIPADVHVV